MSGKLIRICGKVGKGQYFIVGIVVDEENFIIKAPPLLKKWVGKSAIAAYRQFKNRFSFEKMEDKPIVYEDVFEILKERNPVLLRFVEEFELDFC